MPGFDRRLGLYVPTGTPPFEGTRREYSRSHRKAKARAEGLHDACAWHRQRALPTGAENAQGTEFDEDQPRFPLALKLGKGLMY
jgi:hypothetical protein